jgi:prepilin-type N-terminal cleavage/methylation domain-containing protein
MHTTLAPQRIHRTRPRHRRREGLSLIELMLAMTVLAIGLIGMLTMQTLALQGSRHGKQTSEAASVAEQQMQWLQRQPWAAIPVSAWSAPRAVLGPPVGGQSGVPQSYNVSWRVQAGPDASLRLLDVQVTWVTPEAPAATPPSLYAFSSVRHNDP